MTERLYYADSYLRTFDAHVVRRVEYQDQPAIILDQTAFYPTGGGQLNDRGHFGDVEVVDVVESAKGGDVLHVLSDTLQDDNVNGRIDWSLRLDHMQQHSGQHILSQAIIQVLDAETVSFHMSDGLLKGSVTIDLNRIDIGSEQLEQAEDLANQIVFENRAIRARFVDEDELASIRLRRAPKVNTSIRIVEIEGFDWSACGGTHVSHTGAVGQIKIVKLDLRGSELRVEFRCGQRALVDYRQKHHMVTKVAADLSVGHTELDQATMRVVEQNKLLRKQLQESESRVQEYELREVLSHLQEHDGYTLAARVWRDRGMGSLRQIAQRLIERPNTIALLGSSGERSTLLFARSADLKFDMSALIGGAAEHIGGRGGGKSEFAQAGGGEASDEQVRTALEWAAHQLER